MASEAMQPRGLRQERHRGPGTASETPDATALKAARLVTAAVVALIAAASAVGLFVGGLYPDTSSVAAMFRGYDLVTLVVVAPVLAIAALPVLRQSTLAQLLWVSMLGYVVYNYAFYVFGAAFNSVFLLHVAAFSASLFGFVLALAALDPDSIRRHFAIRTPVGWIAGILIVLAAVLGLMWTSLVLQVAFTGQVPPKASSMVLPAAMTHLSWVLDLAVLVPAYLLAGVLLWRRVGWGYVLATVVLVSGFVQQLMYMSALVFQASANVPGASAFDPLEPFITFAYLAGAGLLLLNTKRSAMQTTGTSSSAGSSGQPGRDGGGLSDR